MSGALARRDSGYDARVPLLLTRHGALQTLLCDLFAQAIDLRRWVLAHIDDSLAPHLPGTGESAARMASAVIEEMRARGRVDAALFGALTEAFPARAADIAAVERRWFGSIIHAFPGPSRAVLIALAVGAVALVSAGLVFLGPALAEPPAPLLVCPHDGGAEEPSPTHWVELRDGSRKPVPSRCLLISSGDARADPASIERWLAEYRAATGIHVFPQEPVLTARGAEPWQVDARALVRPIELRFGRMEGENLPCEPGDQPCRTDHVCLLFCK